MTLVKGKMNVLGDALSRAPHIMNTPPSLTNVQMLQIELPTNMIRNYDKDQLFGPIYRALSGILPEDGIQRDRITRLLPTFRIESELLLYENRVCVPRKNVREILKLAHDCKVAGHFSAAKR